ncbi:hypothetical protein EYF80_011041 [Liparis tanakae]|uniref:Uncharacterized protein n=1 Tax=Liparis tanakae TaxID=230148 RepID=A0A4Z2IM59_9TELE|nr:hypothetical protein EYF80_011041 [Liparis tanakae]
MQDMLIVWKRFRRSAKAFGSNQTNTFQRRRREEGGGAARPSLRLTPEVHRDTFGVFASRNPGGSF